MPIYYNPPKEIRDAATDWISQRNDELNCTVVIVYKCRYEFGERLKQLRKAKGLKLKEFAKKIRYAADWVEDMEKGHSLLSLNNLKDFSEFYGVTIEYLMCEEIQEEQMSLF